MWLKSKVTLLASMLVIAGLVSVPSGSVSAASNQIKSASPVYKLLWREEFNSSKSLHLNPNIWEHEIGSNNGWGNEETQYYQERNSTVKNGSLTIKATAMYQDSMDYASCPNGCRYYSSRIKTEGHVGFKYGRIEARIKMPQGQRSWPAFWLLGADIGYSGVNKRDWPKCGEIDIVEIGNNKNQVDSTLHGPISDWQGTSESLVHASPLNQAYHTFAMDWGRTSFKFYLDGNLYSTIDKTKVAQQWPTTAKTGPDWVFNHEFFLVLNLAMGGKYVGGSPERYQKGVEMKVDYIRYYSINGLGQVYKH